MDRDWLDPQCQRLHSGEVGGGLSRGSRCPCSRGGSAQAFVTVQAYAISANLASIPIFSILMRYNLIESRLMGPKAQGHAILTPRHLWLKVAPCRWQVLLPCLSPLGCPSFSIPAKAGSFASISVLREELRRL